jgi:hypothetical protein
MEGERRKPWVRRLALSGGAIAGATLLIGVLVPRATAPLYYRPLYYRPLFALTACAVAGWLLYRQGRLLRRPDPLLGQATEYERWAARVSPHPPTRERVGEYVRSQARLRVLLLLLLFMALLMEVTWALKALVRHLV